MASATTAVAHNLLVERVHLIGRARAATAASDLLLDPSVPLVTLTGPGGMGKTTLALHVAWELLHDFSGGVHFVDLTPLADPTLILTHIARAAGIEQSADLSIAEALADHFRDRHALLLLDNFEHLLDGAPAIGDLLRACPRLHVLATSREPLRLRHERVFPLAPLALPDTGTISDLDALAHVAAVDLFLRRAQAVRPDFVLDSGNAATVAAIVRRLDGLPLALELAAARVRLFSPAALLARLEASPLGVLAGGARDLPDRQKTIRATIAWSCDLLEPADARLFRRLGVFASGFTLEVAGAVAATAFADPAIDAPAGLESLLDKSLIQRLPDGDGEPRFGLLETVRAYALEQLDAVGEADQARRAHFDHYLALAEEAVPFYRGPRMKEWIDRLAIEEDNLRAALSWALASGAGDDRRLASIQLAGALGDFWMYGNRGLEGRAWLDRVLDGHAPLQVAAGSLREADRRRMTFAARAYSAAGSMAWLTGDYGRAKELHERAQISYLALGDTLAAANSRHNVSVQLQEMGEFIASRESVSENIEFYRGIEDWMGVARSLTSLGALHKALGDDHASRHVYRDALDVSRRAHYLAAITMNLSNLAQAELSLGNLTAAEDLVDQARQANKVTGLERLEIDIELALGRLREAQHRHDEALVHARQALERAHTGGYRDSVADALEQVAFALCLLEEPERGARLLGAAAALRERMGKPPEARDQPAYFEQNLPLIKSGRAASDVAFAAGKALSREAAVALALAERTTDDERPAPVASGQPPGNALLSSAVRGPSTANLLSPLTAREREVALLMARGRTNEQIAAELFITLKTVEKHAGNALGKLGFRNRVELAVWAAANGLIASI